MVGAATRDHHGQHVQPVTRRVFAPVAAAAAIPAHVLGAHTGVYRLQPPATALEGFDVRIALTELGCESAAVRGAGAAPQRVL
jgi:hypothetical protein